MYLHQGSHQPTILPRALRLADEAAGDGEAGDTLEDAARGERDYVRERLRSELDREPTEEEINDWLRKHTEGY